MQGLTHDTLTHTGTRHMARALKLTQTEQDQLETLVATLEDARSDIESSIADLDDMVRDMVREYLDTKQTAIKNACDALESFRDDIANDLRDAFNEKSEKWQESDKGMKAESFIDAWENATDLQDEESFYVDVDDLTFKGTPGDWSIPELPTAQDE